MLRLSTLLWLLLFPLAPAHAGDSSLVWRTLETEHFVVYYYEPHDDLGRRVAVVAERAHRVLAPALGHSPSDKTHIVITDDTDGANGFAGVLPRNAIHVYATAPSGQSVLADHDDWLYGLVLHEYAHIVHLDTISGFPRLYNRVFGKIWSPNQVQPRWFIEGLAVYEESRRSSGGRTRNAFFDMFLRLAVLAGQPLDLAQISSGYLPWPHGNVAYLYGGHFLEYIADRFGDGTLAKISHEYGSSVLPYGLSKAVRSATGHSYDELYADFQVHLTRKYTLQKDAVLRRGLIEGRPLTHSGEHNSAPQFSPDGTRIVWHRSDGYARAHYRTMPAGADATSSTELLTLEGAGSLVLLPDGQSAVLDRYQTYRTYYSYADLYRVDLSTRALERLTTGQRATSPDVSPDGRYIAFARNGASRQNLSRLSLSEPTRKPKDLWQGEGRFDQAYTPDWSPDGSQIVFSAWTTGGYRDLYVIDRDGTERHPATRLLADRAMDINPVWSQDGRWIFFCSDRTGVYNVYALDPRSRALKQVTNVLGGIIEFDVSPGGRTLVYSGYQATGSELYALDLDEARWLDADPYVDDRPDPVVVRDDEVPVSASRPYRPLETLAPLTYTLASTLDSYGSAVSVTTGGVDVVGRHAYSLGATYGFERGDLGFGAAYSYHRFWPALRLALARGVGIPGGLVLDGRNRRYHEEAWGFSSGLSLPVLRHPDLNSDLSVSYDVDWRHNVDGEITQNPHHAIPILPETGVSAGVAFRVSLANVKRATYLVGPNGGRGIAVGLRLNDPAVGSDYRSLAVNYRWQEFWAMPWQRTHLLSASLSGAIEESYRRRRAVFALGGTRPQDLSSAILDSTRTSSSGYLRGYAPGSVRGRQFHLLNAEYRVPLFRLEKGLSTLPVYATRLHAAALLDVGNAFSSDFDPRELRVSVGAALRLDAVFGYFAGGAFDLGYAYGLSQGGGSETWLLFTHMI
jgi:hypothetical protein